MQSFNYPEYDRPTSAFVRRRLAEATLSQDQHDGSAWTQLDPGPPAVKSLSQRSQSLHQGLLGNALDHIDEYMNQETHELPVGDFLEARLDSHWSSRTMIPFSQNDNRYSGRDSAPSVVREAESTIDMQDRQQGSETPRALEPEVTATITYYSDDGMLKTLHGVNPKAVIKRCPLLAMAFEESRSGHQLFLETLSSRTAEPFLRFLNDGSYATPSEEWNSGGRYEDVPTSVLLHVEMFRLGDLYDLPDMKSQAYVNVLRQCEFGCSSPDKPIDLCAAIRFVYAHMEKQEQLKDAIIHYCVACFLCHRLGEDGEFKQLAYDLRPFHQELCKNCMDRGYEMETASAIIQMPFASYRPATYASTENHPFVGDVVYHFHANDEMDSPKKIKRDKGESVLPIRSAPDIDMKAQAQAQAQAKMDHTNYVDLIRTFTKNKRLASSGANGSGLVSPFKSEDEFEQIDLNDVPEKAASSDSDSSDWVDVLTDNLKTPKRSSSILTLRSGVQAPVEVEGSDSDSDWSGVQATVRQVEGNESDSDWSMV